MRTVERHRPTQLLNSFVVAFLFVEDDAEIQASVKVFRIFFKDGFELLGGFRQAFAFEVLHAELVARRYIIGIDRDGLTQLDDGAVKIAFVNQFARLIKGFSG